MSSVTEVQRGSYNPAKGMSSYVPYKHEIPNLHVERTDKLGLRTDADYQKAVILTKPEELYELLSQIAGPDNKIDEEDLNKQGKLIEAVLKKMPGGFIDNELCPKDRDATTRYDFISLYVFLHGIQTALAERGGSLKDVMVILEENFFGTDFRRTERGQGNSVFQDQRYANHHLMKQATVVPREQSKGIVKYYGEIYPPNSVEPGSGKPGILINQNLTSYDTNTKKKKTVSNPKRELGILEEIRRLGGAATIHEGDFAGKSSVLNQLVDRLELRHLVRNDSVRGKTGLGDGMIFDLSLAHTFLQIVEGDPALRGKVSVDFYEEFFGTNGRHLISAVLVRQSSGYLGVQNIRIEELQETVDVK